MPFEPWRHRVGERERFLRFVAAGGASAATNATTRWLFSHAVSYETAVALAYLVGMAVAFVLMRRYVFEPAAPDAGYCGQAARFAVVNAGSLAQVWIISVGLVRLVFPVAGISWQPETVAHLIGLCSLTVTSYIAHKRFSFDGVDRRTSKCRV